MTKLPFCFLFLFLLPLISAKVKTLKLSYDSRSLIFLERFRFTHTGHVTISVSSASATSAVGSPDLSRIGIFMLSEASLAPVASLLGSNSSLCLLDSNYVDRLFTFGDLNHLSFNRSYTISSPGEHFLYFERCGSRSVVSMEFRTELYNLDGRGVQDFLSPDLAQWPILCFGFSIVYFAVSSFLVCVCVRNRSSVCRIHLLMCALGVAKALSLSAEAEGMRYVRVMGTTPIGWDVLFYVFDFVGDVILFAVIALLGVGWLFLKRLLEVRALMVVIALRVFANVASDMIKEIGPLDVDCLISFLVFVFAEYISCVAVVFLVILSIDSLEKTPGTDGGKEATKSLAKLALFKQFRMVLIGYLIYTRIMMFKIVTMFKYQWVAYASVEIATLAFFGIVFYMFRPVEKNEYFVIDEAEEQAAEMAIQHEEIELYT